MTTKELQALYDSLRSERAVAKHFGIGLTKAHRLLKEKGVVVRQQGYVQPTPQQREQRRLSMLAQASRRRAAKDAGRDLDGVRYLCHEMKRPCVWQEKDGNCPACRVRESDALEAGVRSGFPVNYSVGEMG